MKNTNAFTLIELLIVVLIIGILAAVALPQYQKTVEKSKATQALTLLKSVYNAAKAYQLANGNWPEDFESLAVTIPFTGQTNFLSSGGHYIQGRSNDDWSIQIQRSESGGAYHGIWIGRLAGIYTGTAFVMWETPESPLPADQIVCVETKQASKPFAKSTGDYCKKIFKGKRINTVHDGHENYFLLP